MAVDVAPEAHVPKVLTLANPNPPIVSIFQYLYPNRNLKSKRAVGVAPEANAPKVQNKHQRQLQLQCQQSKNLLPKRVDVAPEEHAPPKKQKHQCQLLNQNARTNAESGKLPFYFPTIAIFRRRILRI